jgi:hypothetical protein
MKKIIAGKMYNTETATEVHHFNNGLPYSDFKYLEESLYKKKTGEFFLAGNGGAMTKYATRHADGTYSSGENIFPLEINNAKIWAEDHMTTEKYIKVFGEPKE